MDGQTNNAPNNAPPSPLRRAFLKIEELEARLRAQSQARSEPLALVGMACRLPGDVNSTSDLWQLLSAGRDATGEIPPDRWNIAEFFDPQPGVPGKMYTSRGGFLSSVDRFDAAFFGISPREAVQLDPQQRLLLEVTWEALENAGVAPARLRGSRTGVYIGLATNDYAHLQLKGGDLADCNAYFGTGTASSIASGRIAYTLDLRGPALTIDTACSSSLVALHLACRALRHGDCDAALVGGVNLILVPETGITMCQSRMMAADGRCKTFDAAADGFGQAEGCVVVLVKRLSDAKREGDRILALVRGTAINQDGASSGLTAPNGPAQEDVMRAALADAGLQPQDIAYVEAHGTGTSLGDPIEVRALAAVFGAERNANDAGNNTGGDQPLWIGSIKTNLGHLEAAAGLTGLLKVVLSLQQQQIPAHLNFHNPNPLIPWHTLPVRVADRLMSFPQRDGTRIAGLSSFGFSGTNAHVLIEEAPLSVAQSTELSADRRPLHLLTLSARSSQALHDLAARYQSHFEANPQESLADVAYSVNTGRSLAEHRLGVIAHDISEVREALASFLAARPSDLLKCSILDNMESPRVAFVFAGGDAPHAGVVRQLREMSPVFREAYERCEALFSQHLSGARRESRFSQSNGHAVPHCEANRIDWPQPARFSFDWALLCLWRSWGIEPALVMGFGIGEDIAACAAGVVSLEGAVTIAAARLKMESRASDGGAQDEFRHTVEQIPRSDPSITFVSSRTGKVLRKGEVNRADYWANDARGSDRFADGVRAARGLGYQTFLELGTEPILSKLAPEILGDDCLCLSSPGKAEDAPLESVWRRLLETLGQLYLHGVRVDWHGFDRHWPRHKVALPTYPFQRERYWVEQRGKISASETSAQKSPATTSYVPHERSDARAMQDSLDECFYEVRWEETSAAIDATDERPGFADVVSSHPPNVFAPDFPPITPSRDCWLLFADAKGIAEQLALRLRGGGANCTIVHAGDQLRQLPAGGFQLDPTRVEDFRQLLQAQIETGNPFNRIVYLWPVECGVSTATTAGQLGADVERCCRGLLCLLQAIAELKAQQQPPRLWLITADAQTVTEDDAMNGLPQAAVWGMGKVIGLEHPELLCTQIDIEAPGSIEGLLNELIRSSEEPMVSLRRGRRYVARLGRIEKPILETNALQDGDGRPAQDNALPPDATYLISGGLTGLGLAFGQRLIERGARHLLLFGRRAPSDDAAAAINAMRAGGARVVVTQADVSCEADMRRLFEGSLRSLPPLRGVIHSAGSFEDGLVAQQDWASFARVLSPKVNGAWLLHQMTAGSPLDFFILFSSAASLLGAIGHANYAAANAFLDGLSHYRRARGLPSLSINWGAWAQIGVAAEESKENRGTKHGIGTLTPAEGFAALDRAMMSQRPQVGVMRADWSRLATLLADPAQTRFFAHLTSVAPPTPDVAAQSTLSPAARQIMIAPLESRRAQLLAYVRAEVAGVIGLQPDQLASDKQPLRDMGLDSLMAVELRDRLRAGLGMQRTLPTTLAFDHPTIAALTDYLAREVYGWETEPRPGRASEQASDALDLIEQLSDDDVERMFSLRSGGAS